MTRDEAEAAARFLRGSASAFRCRADGSDMIVRGLRDGTLSPPPGEKREHVARVAERAAVRDRREARAMLKRAAEIEKSLGLAGATS